MAVTCLVWEFYGGQFKPGAIQEALQYSPTSPNALNYGKRASCFIKMNFYLSTPAAARDSADLPKLTDVLLRLTRHKNSQFAELTPQRWQPILTVPNHQGLSESRRQGVFAVRLH